jgi:hypothetical protein
LDGIERGEGDTVEEHGREKRVGGKILVRIFFTLLPGYGSRYPNDRDGTKNGLDGRRDGRSKIGKPLQQIEAEKYRSHAKSGLHRDRDGYVGFFLGRGIEIGHTKSFTDDTMIIEWRNGGRKKI